MVTEGQPAIRTVFSCAIKFFGVRYKWEVRKDHVDAGKYKFQSQEKARVSVPNPYPRGPHRSRAFSLAMRKGEEIKKTEGSLCPNFHRDDLQPRI